jgi:hypothetical protein
MPSAFKTAVRFTTLAGAAVLFSACVDQDIAPAAPAAQAAAPIPVIPIAPAAPVPAQISSARKVFIANAGGEGPSRFSGGPNRAYNEFYADMSAWGHYQLVTGPTAADVVLEIRYTQTIIGVGNDEVALPQLRLEIRDPGSGGLLWGITEQVNISWFPNLPVLIPTPAAVYDAAFDKAMTQLVGDLQALYGQPA